MSKQTFDFLRGRIEACPLYGFSSGEELLKVVNACAYYCAEADELTSTEFSSIINLCETAHIKMMEGNYNAEWQNQ